jgi:tetratricopeptide (TPR) repeat protein
LTAAGHRPAVAAIGVQAESISVGRDFTQLLFQDVTPQDIAAAARLQSLHRFQSNIPARRNISFVGRDDLLDRMLDRLGDPSAHNVIILHGSPGVGKSELAREFARRHRNRYPGGTFLIEAGTNVAKIDLARIGRVFLDLEFASDLRIDDQCLRTLCTLGTTPSLLIFDNIRSIDDARSLMPPAGMPCHVVATTVLDRWDATWQALSVKPLSNKASLELITEIVGRELADRHGEKLATLAGGLPVQLVPASATLAYEARRGRDDAITLTLAQEASESFQGVYKMLEPPARLLLHAAANLNSQRIVRDELEVHLAEAADWSVAEFRDHLDACLDVHVVEGLAELRMHQLFVAFLVKIDPSDEIAASLMRIAKVQAQRFADIAESLVNAPNQADLAATLTTYPVELESWKGPGREILLEKGEVVGGALNVVGRFAAARPWFERAVTAKENGVHDHADHESLGRSLNEVGCCLSRTGEFAAARPWFERAVTAKEKGDVHGRVDHESLGRSLHEVGDCLSRSGAFAAARPWFERAVTAKEKGDAYGRVNHTSLGISMHQVSYCLSSTGAFAAARPWSERAITEAEKGDPHGRVDHERLSISLHQMGHCLFSTGEFVAARPWFERAVAEAEKGDAHGRVDHESIGGSLDQVGYCLSGTAAFGAARPWFERAVTAKEKGDLHGRVDHESLGRSLHQVGYCLCSTDQFTSARPLFERAVAAKEKGDVYGRVNHDSLGRSLYQVGYCLWRTNEFAGARACFECAVAAKEKGDVHGRVDHASLAQTLRNGARCLRMLGLVKQSKAWDKRASRLT